MPGPASAHILPRAPPSPAQGPPRHAHIPPSPTAHSHLLGPATGSPARRRWRWRHLREGRKGRVRAGRLPGWLPGGLSAWQVSLSEVKGVVSCREGADRWRRWKGLPRTPGAREGSERCLRGSEGPLTWRGGHLQSHAGQDQHCTQMEPRG